MTARGRVEVARRKQRLTALFSAIDGAGLSGELTSHYARYLCVLVSGFVEQSVKELVTEYCRNRSAEPIQRYVGSQLKRLRNIDSEKLKQLIESYSVDWWRIILDKYPDQLESIGSIATVRNNVSHGGDAGITMSTIRQYFNDACVLMDELSDLFDPE
ncbi:HEPN domain-containing protein [Streptomyces griseoviridis]|uniref:HEPN domain-containing protein n=1 Tax=Streptomyces griseoviridis TaxID=45398 RepID=UPI001679E0BD